MSTTTLSVALTDQEVGFFVDNGYLVKQRILDRTLMEMAVDRVWKELPTRFDRENPSTWFGPVLDCCGVGTVEKRRGRMKFRERLRTEPPMLDLITNVQVVWDTVEQLLGCGWVKRPTRIRGLYPILPCPDRAGQTVKGHVDKHAYHVGVIGYLEDVPESGGAFTVWPGSHAELHSRFRTRHERTLTRSGRRRMNSLNRCPGREILGAAGDVIFYHHRLLHAAGINIRPHVRQAVLADFSRLDIEELKELKPSKDMWEDWAVR